MEAHVTRAIRIETADTGPRLDWFGATLRFPVRSRDTGGRLCVQIAHMPRSGLCTPAHCHGSEDEIFYVLAGRLEVETPRQRVTLDTGDLAIAPRGLPHRVAALDEGTRTLTIITPGSLEDAFFRIATDPTPQHLLMEMAVWDVHGVEQRAPYRHPLAPDPKPLRVVRADEGDAFWLASDEYTVKVSSAALDARLCVVHFRIPPRGGPVVHTHTREEEIFHVLRGDVAFYSDGAAVRGREGDTAVLPRGIPHCFRNVGDAEAEFLAIITPAGFDEFVSLAGTPATPHRRIPKADAAELERLTSLSERFGVRIHPEIAW